MRRQAKIFFIQRRSHRLSCQNYEQANLAAFIFLAGDKLISLSENDDKYDNQALGRTKEFERK